MLKVFKYPIKIEDNIEISLPEEAQILTVGEQNGIICVWALVNPEKPSIKRNFRLAGTGHPIDTDKLFYHGTAQILNLVFHLFEIIS